MRASADDEVCARLDLGLEPLGGELELHGKVEALFDAMTARGAPGRFGQTAMPAPSPLTPDVITRTSPWSVAETIERLEAAIRERGIKLFAVIDHSGEAAAAGLKLRNTKLLVFGSPQAGTPVMAVRPLAALDLPLKLLVWDHDGRTCVSYVSPGEIAARHGLTEELAGRLGGAEAVASIVFGEAPWVRSTPPEESG